MNFRRSSFVVVNLFVTNAAICGNYCRSVHNSCNKHLILDKLFLEAIRKISRENVLSTFYFQLIFQLKSGNQHNFFQVEFVNFYSLSVSLKFI